MGNNLDYGTLFALLSSLSTCAASRRGKKLDKLLQNTRQDGSQSRFSNTAQFSTMSHPSLSASAQGGANSETIETQNEVSTSCVISDNTEYVRRPFFRLVVCLSQLSTPFWSLPPRKETL